MAKATSSSARPSSRRTSSWVARRVQEGVDVHAAIDGGILRGSPDAGRERLFGHGVAHTDDRVALSAARRSKAV